MLLTNSILICYIVLKFPHSYKASHLRVQNKKKIRYGKQHRFEPKIIAFCCNWCSYAGADLAGGMRLKYAANITPIRVMCSARVSPHFIIRAFQEGADGVLVAGCHIGDCHYLKGNYIAIKRVAVFAGSDRFSRHMQENDCGLNGLPGLKETSMPGWLMNLPNRYATWDQVQ